MYESDLFIEFVVQLTKSI